jgi:Domain of unknown function (DUF1877)
MACRGVHFAITTAQMDALRKAAGDDEAVVELVDAIEGVWDAQYLAESDKAWDAIHRCLTDGQLEFENGEYPLNRCVLGGDHLHEGEDYIVALVTPKEVRDVAQALEPITEAWLRDRYFGVLPKNYAPEYGEDDFGYTWSNLEGLRDFYVRAAEAGRAVIFTSSQ